jgi:hypothetical protein
MKKPQLPPPAKFASEADKQEHMLDCVCWFYAERHPDGPGTVEERAEGIKQLLLSGRVVINFDEEGDRFRIVPTVLLDAQGTA